MEVADLHKALLIQAPKVLTLADEFYEGSVNCAFGVCID